MILCTASIKRPRNFERSIARELEPLFRDLAPRLHRVVQFDFANLLLYEPDRRREVPVLETPIRLTPALPETVRWKHQAVGFGRHKSRGSFPV